MRKYKNPKNGWLLFISMSHNETIKKFLSHFCQKYYESVLIYIKNNKIFKLRLKGVNNTINHH